VSLDIWLRAVVPTVVHETNITHNLGPMAREAGIYQALWRPDENGITKAYQLISPITDGLVLMRNEPERFRKHDAPNGWGTYDQFVPWLQNLLAACVANPNADIEVSR
jgi:hypothetical protein